MKYFHYKFLTMRGNISIGGGTVSLWKVVMSIYVLAWMLQTEGEYSKGLTYRLDGKGVESRLMYNPLQKS